MIKEEMKEVKAVQVVLEVCKEYLDKKEDMPLEVMQYVVDLLENIEKDYNKTICDLESHNSLVVKMERLIELIGTIGTISVEDVDKLDNTLIVLEDCAKAIKD